MNRPPRILVAGIGNPALGDDAFGIEVVRACAHSDRLATVIVRDFGLRGRELAQTLCEDWDAAIVVDATPRGRQPGSVFVLELDLPRAGQTEGKNSSLFAAGDFGQRLDPVAVLQLAASLGARIGRLFLIGGEPARTAVDGFVPDLSPRARSAVPRAVAMIEALAARLLTNHAATRAHPAPALLAHS